MTCILLIEDDVHLAAGMRYSLERAGYEVRHADDGPGGLLAIEEEQPDLVVLDLMLPEIDGFELLSRLRASGSKLPVIILSAKAEEEDRVRGFDTGANDFMGKPFGMRELLARIRARLPKPGALPAKFALGEGVVRLASLEFEHNGQRTALTTTEARLLGLLREHAGRPVDRRDILRAVWGTRDCTTRTLDTHIARLRRKLEPDPSAPRHIRTVHGVGYRLEM